jgi:hypothetical protein
MAGNQTFRKRERERARQERQREKQRRREERRSEKSDRPRPDGEDPDIAGIVPGPQPLPDHDLDTPDTLDRATEEGDD